MRLLRSLLAFALGLGFPAAAAPLAAVKFVPSEIHGQASEVIFCDLDGDHLKAAVLCDRTNLWMSRQDAKGGFAQPRRIYQAERPSIVWAASLGRRAESLLIAD